MIVADSDVLIDALRGRRPVAERIYREMESRNLATTTVSAFELLSGARTPFERIRVERLLRALAILPLDLTAGAMAATIRRDLESAGRAIGFADYLIAGICISYSHQLLTRNLAHFGRIPALALASLDL